MTTEQSIKIPISKLKMVKMLAGSLAFVAIGCWFVIAPPHIDNAFFGNPTRLAIIGYGSIFFFGLCAVFFIRKLGDTGPGLIINNTGLTDNSGALAAGEVLWEDVENISVLNMANQQFLMLAVKNPGHYINRQKSLLKRKGLQLNYKQYGTPVCITANGLTISFQELHTLVTQKFKDTRQTVPERDTVTD